MKEKLAKIAKDILSVKTLETRNSDSLDFYDMSVWQIKEALELAYKLGKEKKT